MNLKIRTKILTCFFWLTIIAALIGWVGLSALSKVRANVASVYNDQLVPVRALGNASTSLQATRAEMRNMLLEKNVAERQKYVQVINDEDRKFDDNLAEYLKSSLVKEEQDNIAVFKPAYEQYRQERAKAIELLLNGQDAAAWKIMNGDAKLHMLEASQRLRKLIEINDNLVKMHTEESKAAATAAQTQMFALLIVGVLACLSLGLVTARLLGRPIAEMQHAAEKLASGVFSVSFDIDNKDEMGALASALSAMRDNIQGLVTDTQMLVHAATEGNLSIRADASKHQGEYRKVVEGVNATLDAVIGPLNIAAECFNKIGNGQVPQRITKEYSGEFATLKESVNSCITGLEGLQEVNSVLQLIAVNDYSRQIEGHYPGLFGEVAAATNEAILRLLHVTEITGLIAEGNFRTKLTQLKQVGQRSTNDSLIPAFIKMMEAISALVDDSNMLATAAVQGKLATRADAARHQGDYRKVVEGVNATLDAVIGPLRDVEQALGKLSDGDFTATIQKEYAGEFNHLKESVNTMVAQVRAALLKIGKETNSLASASEQLGSVSQQMSASAEETAAQANVVSAASEQVSTNIQTVATGADEMGASIKEIAKNTAEASKIANNAVQLSKTTNETVRKLGSSSAEIGQVIKVITSIAQQTNLLALNATIEAARAGEAGKGFAVVANEVKELAKQTAQATEDISQKIQAIQEDAGGAVTAIGQITEVIGQISDIQNTVATAIEEQSATTNEISRNLAEAAKGGADITLNITSVAQVAKTTTEAAGQTQMSAKSLEQTAAQLRELVGQFRYEDHRAMAVTARAGK
ncbi:MAG TPA: MCP four helix bundle domain-containing protein [Candidatus Acidoferrales bacterium]|nr:MCP four helix bundle domain-containing protein [Candidatus Acidoferrales bacterium]